MSAVQATLDTVVLLHSRVKKGRDAKSGVYQSWVLDCCGSPWIAAGVRLASYGTKSKHMTH